jgi:hypothetical protein
VAAGTTVAITDANHTPALPLARLALTMFMPSLRREDRLFVPCRPARFQARFTGESSAARRGGDDDLRRRALRYRHGELLAAPVGSRDVHRKQL